MHELGIVFHIANQVQDVAKENGVDKIHQVTLSVGEVSTVIGEYLIDCWNWNSKKTEMLKDCKLEIEKIEAVTFCEDCKKEYKTVEHGKTCPYCGGGNTYLVAGNEVMIKEILVDEPENGETGDDPHSEEWTDEMLAAPWDDPSTENWDDDFEL